jgi:hypothetical protein
METTEKGTAQFNGGLSFLAVATVFEAHIV